MSSVTGKGRLYFPNTIRYPADAGTLQRYQMRGLLADGVYQAWLDANPIIRIVSICGYNPQKLLPAPTFEREMLQSISEWATQAMKMPYTEFAQSVFNTLTRDGEVTFTPTGRYREPIDVQRWNEANATPLEDLQRWVDTFRDPVVIVSGDFGELEMKVIRYMHATHAAESAGGMPSPRGRVEIFDYDDQTRINLEGEGILPGLIDETFWLKARNQGKTDQLLRMKTPPREHASPKREQSYLDHDPTKRHKRRKRK